MKDNKRAGDSEVPFRCLRAADAAADSGTMDLPGHNQGSARPSKKDSALKGKKEVEKC